MSSGIRDWLQSVSGEGWHWYVKFLSGNDTLLNDTHQAGPYFPKKVVFELFPSLQNSSESNPRKVFPARIDSHDVEIAPTVIWYNNKQRGGTRDECRITNWGGSSSPLLDPDSTGSLCVFAFHKGEYEDADQCHIWLCSSPIPGAEAAEEDIVQDHIGPVEPGAGVFYHASGTYSHPVELLPRKSPCQLQPSAIKHEWLLQFPEASAVVAMAVDLLPAFHSKPPDERLIRRRDCEFEIFRAIEDAVVMPRVKEGFATVDIFVDFANKVTNRRKARSGASLELHARTIFDEEGIGYSHGARSEGNKKPDFLFPSAEAYHDGRFPVEKLRMLGVKTTCKDRWRQILNEADRIERKHLLTLQEGLSLNQFQEMKAEGVTLVVPKALHGFYPEPIRSALISLDRFIQEVGQLG